MPAPPPLTVELAMRRLQEMPEAERPRALDILKQRDPAIHAKVMDALWGATVNRPASGPPSFGSGALIGGKFEVVQTLGEGASGSVFRARDTTHIGDDDFGAREVALKVSRIDTGHDGLHRDLLQKEARLLSRLRHPRLPVVEALFEDRGRWVLVMEYIAGDSLQQRRRARAEPFPVAEVLPWLRDTLRVLDYLHTIHTRRADGGAPVSDTPIFHRDIKPANLILDPHDNLYVVDLGIARSGISELTSVVPSAVGAGSPGYAAPEVDRGEDTLPQSDLYSVGMTALTLLTRDDAREFSTRRRSDALHSGAPDPLHEALDRADLPASLREWIRTATALAPDKRFATASDMIEALGRPPAPPASVSSSPSPSRRSLVLALLAAVVFAATAVGAWAVWPDATADGTTEAQQADVLDDDPLLVAEADPVEADPIEADPIETPPVLTAPPPQAAAPAPVPTGPPASASGPVAVPERRPEPPPVQTGAVRATVLGEDGGPLAGARVTVVGQAASAASDGVGDVRFAGLPAGVHMLEVRADGYVARQFRVEVAPGETTTRTLQFDIEDLALDAY